MSIQLNQEQEEALHDQAGIVHGDSFVLLSSDAFLELFGITSTQLAEYLAPAIQSADQGRTKVWNKDAFLKRMHEKQRN